MNLFILDNNIELSAKYHCDKHIVKMPTETDIGLTKFESCMDEQFIISDNPIENYHNYYNLDKKHPIS